MTIVFLDVLTDTIAKTETGLLAIVPSRQTSIVIGPVETTIIIVIDEVGTKWQHLRIHLVVVPRTRTSDVG